jgi:hypothetical protein
MLSIVEFLRAKTQENMAKHLKAIFGDKLLADPLERYPVKFRNLILTLFPQLNRFIVL